MAKAITNQIVGLVRFSYPSKGGFAKTEATTEEVEDKLYDPDRLARRFAMFEALTLPTLLAQTDQDFQTIFLIGRSLPATAKERLQDLISPLKGGVVVELAPLNHYFATQRAYGKLRDDTFSHFTSFRLDDDDAMDTGYIARLRSTIAALQSVTDPSRPIVYGANRGIFLERKPEGNQFFDVAEKLPLGIGLSLTVPQDVTDNIFRRNHRHLPCYYTTFTDIDTPAFIRTVHSDNDSDPHASGIIRHMTDDQVETALDGRFPFSLEQLKAL